MATDFAVIYFMWPVIVGILVMLSIAVLGRNRPITSRSFLGLGASRIAIGYIGALSALLAYSVVTSLILGRTKVALGHVTAAEASQLTPGWALYLFILVTPFAVFFLTVLGLPALALLRRFRFASLAGALITSQLIAVLFAIWPLAFPYNQWCSSHSIKCFGDAYASGAVVSTIVAMGFALAARLPWLRSSSLQANNSFKPKPLRGSA